MLSRYVPPQNLQIEFLNKWRNTNKYTADDPLSPAKMPFDYLFAITLMAQPLAWFEATGLPEEAFKVSPFIKKYRQIQADIHQGQIFPIGQEPSGTGWTGFQSMNGRKGYFLVFREFNEHTKAVLPTFIPASQQVACRLIAGQGKDFEATADEKSQLSFQLPAANTFALYAYEIR